MQYRTFDLKELKVDKSYQRTLNEAMVKKIVKAYDESAFGVLLVAVRDNDSKYVVDGQTRLSAAKDLGIGKVPCVWFRSSGKQQEAKMFRLVNNHVKVSRLQRTYALYCEGDEVVRKMVRTLRRFGMNLGFKSKAREWGNIMTVAPVQKLSENNCLARVMNVVIMSWDGEVEALSGALMSGFECLYRDYGDQIDDQRLAEVLSATTPAKIRTSGDARRLDGGSRGSAICDALKSVYNRKLKRSAKLK